MSVMDSCQGWIHVRDGFMSVMDSCQKDPAVVYHSQFPEGAGDRVQATGCRRSGAGDRVQANFAVGKGPIAAPLFARESRGNSICCHRASSLHGTRTGTRLDTGSLKSIECGLKPMLDLSLKLLCLWGK